MIPIEYIIAFAMAITNVVKKRLPDNYNDLIPFIAFILSVLLNLINALVFKSDALQAIKDAFISAGVALALFSGGSAVSKLTKP